MQKGGEIIFKEEQTVKVKWNNTNKEWYESKGYKYTKRYDVIDILAKDLSPNSSARIKAICDYCGREYETSYAVLIEGRRKLPKDACRHCAPLKANELNFKKRTMKNIGLAQEICLRNSYRLLTTVDEYTDINMKVSFICPKHGNQTMMLSNLISGHKCIKCSYEAVGKKLKHSYDYIKKTIESVNGNILLNPQDYKGSHIHNLQIRCSCGKIFTTSFSNYTRAKVNTCFTCSCKESSGERSIKEFLEKHNVEFIQEKRFDDCRDVKPLPFDFYLPKYNLIIEFDGQHHFKETGFNNHNITVKHDEMKNYYCKSHNIDLLRIPYWEGNSIEQIILNRLIHR